jgi:hypothetical protein
MTETNENSPLSHSQKTYLDSQKQFGFLFGTLIAVFFIFNITSGVSVNLLNLIFGIIIYRGLHRRFAASTIISHPNLSNKQLFVKTIWVFTWRTFLAFLAFPAIFVTLIEPDTRQGQALGLYIGYFVINFALSADRGFWLIRKFRSIPNEPSKIESVAGLSSNQKIIRNALIVLAVLFGIIFLGTIFNQPKTPEKPIPKPLPSTRNEEMQQRMRTHAQRTGDSRLQEVYELNAALYKSLEQSSARLIKASDKLNGDVLFELRTSSGQDIEKEIKTLREIEQSALEVKDEFIIFEETIKRELAAKFADSPEEVREALNISREGNRLFNHWVQSAVTFSQAGLRHIAFFKDTGRIDDALELAVAQSGVEFANAAEKVDEKAHSNFKKMEEIAPR